ncbi:MAG: EAL domain-containing protein [Candidatus Izemoplasmatales bacterium]|nr:EAL domain-containing protein [Candidatus Izemoplasmatales bacterium]
MEALIKIIRKNHKLIAGSIILLSMPGIYLLVYYTGGIKYVYSHTMYIPILLAGIIFGFKGGTLIAIVGGILLGPIMPLEVDLGTYQETLNWVYRLMIFLVIGGLSGYYSKRLRKINKINERLFSHHVETDIPNLNYLLSLSDDYISGSCLVSTIYINNKNHIIDVLGLDFYHKALNALYLTITKLIPQPNCVIQPENDKVWLVMPSKYGLKEKDIITNISSKEINVQGIKVYLDYSIGIAGNTSFKDCKNLSVFKDTDKLALYAKTNNLPYAIYDKSILKERYQFDLLSVFSDALNNDETFMVYQPVIRSDNKVEGFESLIRWNNSVYGLIMPNDFIPLVESTQLIHQMTDWVIRKVFRKQKEMADAGYDLPLSINLSVKNLSDMNFSTRVNKIMKEEDANPKKVIFEITETMLLKDNPQFRVTLETLKALGFKIAIDDFGKGYSSISYLCQYPIDYIKIDRFFLNDLQINTSMFEIVKAIVNLSHQLNLEVVAEGVETKEVLDMIKAMDCDLVQGYYYSKPIEGINLVKYIIDFEK